jgi:putative protein kinase ArgK-like GTPase of G3E family
MLAPTVRTTGGSILLDRTRLFKHLSRHGSIKMRRALDNVIRSQLRHAL